MDPRDRIWFPLDTFSEDTAASLLEALVPAGVTNFKVGLELITAIGVPAAVGLVKRYGEKLNVWLDGKFCDIPNTVAGASKAAVAVGANMFNVHASCGFAGMRAAAQNKGDAKAIAVTVLTSLQANDLYEIGYLPDLRVSEKFPDQPRDPSERDRVAEIVLKMAWQAWHAGLDGIVCSPQELKLFPGGNEHGPFASNFMKVTPGVRPAWAAANDQKRVMTPGEAVKAGASALVIGRPISSPPKEVGTPADAFKRICDEIAAAV